MTVKILSLNVRGIGDPVKRRAIFNYYRARADILCLQETHSDQNCVDVWTAEWGGDAYFLHGSTNAHGVAILCKKFIPYRVIKQSTDLHGRLIVCDLEHINDPTKHFTLGNIYGPNADKPQVFAEAFEKLSCMSVEMILMGDFNLVMDTRKDRRNSDINYWNSHGLIEKAITDFEMIDIWRARNADVELFSWKRGNQASRIDYGLVTQ